MPSQNIRELTKALNGGSLNNVMDVLAEANDFEKAAFLKLAKESAERSQEAIRLWRPLPFQDQYHRCTATECILVKGNRAGGSACGFMEDARAVTGRDPYDKYPKRDGTLVCLGYGEKHIARVIHAYLFRAGAFKIIRDLETRQWRVYRPWSAENGGDLERESEAKPAPPYIPPRYIEEIVWEKAGQRVFSIARLTTGWQIYALNSAGDPSQAQGFDVDLYHIDEDTARPGWYEEAVARIAMRNGKLRWTALPHAKNDDILSMMQRAEEEADKPNPHTVCVRASIYDNPYLNEKARKAMVASWAGQGDDIVRKRAYGELVLDSVLMYPQFSPYTHDVLQAEQTSVLLDILKKSQYEPPVDWCIDMVVDPGHTVAAVLFIATPPSKLGEFHYVFRELYLTQCTAQRFGDEVYNIAKNLRIQRWIIDMHGGRITGFVTGKQPYEAYQDELRQRGITSIATGGYFEPGCDDIKLREEALRGWLHTNPETKVPRLMLNGMTCPNTVREFKRFKKKQTVSGGIVVTLDEGNRRGATHAIECCEYAAAHGLPYIEPPGPKRINSFVSSILAGRKRREAKRAAKLGPTQGGIILGPRGG